MFLASSVFALACGAGITMYEEKSDGFDLWLPTGSDFKKHNDVRYRNKIFSSF